ncbi:neuraminidase-like domain-containing protein [Neptunomonas phycophila]|uniref:Tc toxin subunit A-related protein n=1 Tax=Neptunomonas phycophila TaxID=1572645 RepID=UPI001BE63DC7|nr:neuraminidase-like domain-containing protein [Neptunomonas phycophila]MBT3146065.1 hypothetical protein [Neptunomonas phycophila]
MNRISFPLKLQMSGIAIADLQNALQILLKHQRLLANHPAAKDELSNELNAEQQQQYFDGMTAKLVSIFQHENQLANSGEVDEATAKVLNQMLEELGVLDPAPAPEPEPINSSKLIVLGAVTYIDGKPASDLIVQAFDRDMRSEELLGKAITDSKGGYKIAYTAAQFQKTEKVQADLLIKALNKNGTLLATSEIFFNAEQEQTINLTLAADALSDHSEYERYVNELKPLLGGVTLADLTADDIKFLSGETGITEEHLGFIQFDASWQHDHDVEPAVFYGLFRKGLPHIFRTLLAEKPARLRTELKEAIAENIVPRSLATMIDDIIDRLSELAIDAAFVSEADDEIAPIGAVIATTNGLSQNQQKTFVKSMLNYEPGTDSDFWEIVLTELGDDNAIKSVQRTLQAGVLTDNHLPVLKQVQQELQGESVKVLAAWSEDDWLAVIDRASAHGKPVPATFKNANEYARSIVTKVDALMPSQSLLARANKLFETVDVSPQSSLFTLYANLDLASILEQPGLDQDAQKKAVQAKVGQFNRLFQNNPTLDLRDADLVRGQIVSNGKTVDLQWGNIQTKDRGQILKQARAFQRVLPLAKDTDTRLKLLSAGFDSSHKAAKTCSKRLAVQAQVPIEDAEKVRVSANAQVTANETVRHGIASILFNIPLSVDNVGAGVVESFRELTDVEQLFGAQNFCDCANCSSVLSQSAYFVDLMAFVETNVSQNPEVFATDVQRESVLYLRNRRPDLWSLELNCNNIHQQVPYLEVVNHTFEQFLINHLTSVTSRDGLYQYLAELDPYTTFNQPYWPAQQELNLYLSHFNLTRDDVFKIIGRVGDSQKLAYLNVAQYEFNIITQPDASEAHIRRLYDAQGSASSRDPLRISMRQFMKTTGLSREQVTQLRVASTLYPFALTVSAEAVEGGLDQLFEEEELQSTDKISALNRLDVVHRWVRLWRKTSWSIIDFDFVLSRLASAKVIALASPEVAVYRIADLKRLQNTLQLDVEQIVSLFYLIPDLPEPRFDARPDPSAAFLEIHGVLQNRLFGEKPLEGNITISAFNTDSPTFEFDNPSLVYRLLAGLSVSEPELITCITALRHDLETSPSGDVHTLTLTLENLSLLYRHALLARKLNQSIGDFFTIIQLVFGTDQTALTTIEDMLLITEKISEIDSLPFSLSELSWLLHGRGNESFGLKITEADFANLSSELQSDIDVKALYLLLSNIYGWKHEVSKEEKSAELPPEAAVVMALTDMTLESMREAAIDSEASLHALVKRLDKWRLIQVTFELDVSHQRFIADNTALFSDIISPNLVLLNHLAFYKNLVTSAEVELDVVHAAIVSFEASDNTLLAELLQVEPSLLASLKQNSVINFNANALSAILQLQNAIKLCQTIGVNGNALTQITASDYSKLQIGRDAMLGAFMAKYPDEAKRTELLEPYSESILEFRRDALVDYLLSPAFNDASPRPLMAFKDQTDLYRFFLMDSEMEGCARTSWVLAGISSVQLYVQRCLMNLEQNSDGLVTVPPAAIPRAEWVWRKNYRVWEANRRVFLYPENYLYSDLRDDKTPFFEESVDELQQQEISQESVESAYKNYFDKFMKVANMNYVGAAYHSKFGGGPLYLFARTAEDPPQYHYRTLTPAANTKTGIWSHWHKIDLPINAKTVSPIVYQGKLYVFWVDIKTRMLSEVKEGTSRLTGYAHTIDLTYSYKNAKETWEPQTKLRLREALEEVLPYPPETSFRDEHGQEIMIPIQCYLSKHMDVYTSIIDPLTKDEHTLSGFEWDRVYPYLDDGQMLFRYGSTIDNKQHLSHKRYSNKVSLLTGMVEQTTEVVSFNDLYWLTSLAEGPRLAGSLPVRRVHDALAGKVYKILAMHSTSQQNFIASVDTHSYLLKWSTREYSGIRLGSEVVESIGNALHEQGLDRLLSIETQFANSEPDEVWPSSSNVKLVSETEKKHIDFKGACGNYYRELFCHLPLQIAENLNANQKFEEAQRWYHYIFDPTANENTANPSDRNWRYAPFRFQDLPNFQEMLTDEAALEQYRSDPFNPWAIARLRPSAMQKTVVMKYIDNLLDWGDHLFTQDSYESINEATLLYITALDILGERPVKRGACSVPESTTYDEIAKEIDGESEFVVLENLAQNLRSTPRLPSSARRVVDDGTFSVVPSRYQEMLGRVAEGNISSTIPVLDLSYLHVFIPADSLEDDTGANTSDATIASSSLVDLSKVRTVFCIPENEHLLGYWDRVEDRLFKIRNCMNISGMRRALALYAPRIDPMLLVRAKAAGLSLEDVLNLEGDPSTPLYRFQVLLERARNLSATVQSFGGALLSALEKKDAEELNQMRTTHEQNIISLTRKVKQNQIAEAQRNHQGLVQSKRNVEARRDHYASLVEEGLIPLENTQQVLRGVATALKGTSSIAFGTSSIAALVPQIGSPFAMKYGGAEFFRASQSWADSLNQIASMSNDIAASLGLAASFRRREQDWEFQRDTAERELNQLEQQIEAAKLREEITVRDLEVYEKTVEQTQEQYDFVKGKFTQVGLYNWMVQHLTRLHRQAYMLAYEAAMQAEKSYQFERGNLPETFIEPNHWEQDKAGLLAGEQLTLQLQQMEQSFHSTNKRQLEITKNISLKALNPAALIDLKAGGRCEFVLPEVLFDLDLPGHFQRRIKAVRISIPCVVGPYVSINATLNLNKSYVRWQPNFEEDLVEQALESTSIVASSAQGDSGMFEFNFRDERYLPFEGAGVISSWELKLPEVFRQFDYNTISDVIVHISYTALDDAASDIASTAVKEGIKNKLNTWLNLIGDEKTGLEQAISLRQDFGGDFHHLLQLEEGLASHEARLLIDQNHFPYFLRSLEQSVNEVLVFVQLKEENGGGLPTDQAMMLYKSPSVVTDRVPLEENAQLPGLLSAVFTRDFGLAVGEWVFGIDSALVEQDRIQDIILVLRYEVSEI